MRWVWWVVVFGAGRLAAEEPAAAFLNALREQQYNDAALVYLDRMEADARTPEAFRQEIPLERGMTMIQAAVQERNAAARENLLSAAKENLERFLREQPDHPRKSSARRQFGFLLREWARIKVEQAARTSEPTMRKEAAALYDQAYTVFDNAVTELREQLAKIQGQPEREVDDNAGVDLEALRNEYLDALLRRAEVLESKADTEPAGSAERTKLLTDAVALYDDMYTKYWKFAWGVRARLNQVRTLVKLNDLDKALQCVTKDVIDQAATSPPDKEVARKLVTQGFVLAMDCWLHESRQEYAQAVASTTPWVAQIRPAEETDADWIQLKLQLARANRAWAEVLQAKNPRDPQVAAARDAARQLARQVARAPGGDQEAARTLLRDLPGGGARTDTAAQPVASTFEEAKTNAVDAIAEMQNEQDFVVHVPERLERETNEDRREELREQLAVSEESIARNHAAAMDNLLRALQLADAQTPLDDLNLVLRLLAHLHFLQEDYYDAAVLGEFVGRKFPGSAGAQLCARIALLAYLKLYETGEAEDKEFASDHIVSLAAYMVNTWAGSPEAADAINALIPFLISRGEMAKAREYVEGIPENSPQRASAELRVGESLWRDYLLGMDQVRQWERDAQEPDAAQEELQDNIARRKPELEELKQNALQVLETGVERMRQAGTVDATVPRAVLALAQIYVNLDQASQAIALLDDEKIGALAMVQRNDPVLDTPALREHAYRVALSAVVSALPKVTDGDARTELIARSQQLMQALRTEVGDTPEAQQRLVEIFYSLARGLETQIKLLERPEDRRALSDGFRAFLDEVRGQATDLRVLNWVAESYTGLGSGLSSDKASADAARGCYTSAVATYQQILDQSESLGVTPDMKRQVLVRQALARRAVGQYEQAIQTFRTVLAEDDCKVNVQIEAALTYQLWGAEPKQALKYKNAIGGGEVDPRTQRAIIWGWNRIAQATARYKEHREIYFQARYQAAHCYYEYATHMRAPADREKYLKYAKDCIVVTYRLYPKLGGAEWYPKYNALLKKIQSALRESPVGLAAETPALGAR